MKTYETPLYKRLSEGGFHADPMTIWVGNDACCGKASGYLVWEHIGIEQLREYVGKGYKVYSLRESDELNCEPATLELNEVRVNFFGYFVSDTDFDWCFKERDYQPLWTWDYDPWADLSETRV